MMVGRSEPVCRVLDELWQLVMTVGVAAPQPEELSCWLRTVDPTQGWVAAPYREGDIPRLGKSSPFSCAQAIASS